MSFEFIAAVRPLATFWAWQSQDFKLPKLNDVENKAAEPVKQAMGALSTVDTGPSTTTILIGAGAAVAAAGLFLLLRSALFNHLIERRVPPSSARGASWAFYAFLTATTWAAITGFVVNLWTNLPFLIGGGVVALATFFFFLMSYMGAVRRAH